MALAYTATYDFVFLYLNPVNWIQWTFDGLIFILQWFQGLFVDPNAVPVKPTPNPIDPSNGGGGVDPAVPVVPAAKPIGDTSSGKETIINGSDTTEIICIMGVCTVINT